MDKQTNPFIAFILMIKFINFVSATQKLHKTQKNSTTHLTLMYNRLPCTMVRGNMITCSQFPALNPPFFPLYPTKINLRFKRLNLLHFQDVLKNGGLAVQNVVVLVFSTSPKPPLSTALVEFRWFPSLPGPHSVGFAI